MNWKYNSTLPLVLNSKYKINIWNWQFIERDVFPEKHFEQVSVTNDHFSGVIKWKSNKRPSWSRPGTDQWRFELRFDEVNYWNDQCMTMYKLNRNIKYFHQVKSGVEKQYRNGSLSATFNFPNQENFFLYGIRKFQLSNCFSTD